MEDLRLEMQTNYAKDILDLDYYCTGVTATNRNSKMLFGSLEKLKIVPFEDGLKITGKQRDLFKDDKEAKAKLIETNNKNLFMKALSIHNTEKITENDEALNYIKNKIENVLEILGTENEVNDDEEEGKQSDIKNCQNKKVRNINAFLNSITEEEPEIRFVEYNTEYLISATFNEINLDNFQLKVLGIVSDNENFEIFPQYNEDDPDDEKSYGVILAWLINK